MSNFIDLDEIKQELNDTGEAKDDILQFLADAIEALWDEKTARTWFLKAHTIYLNADADDKMVFLPDFPVATSPAPRVWDDTDWVFGSDDELTLGDDFRLDYEKGIVYFDDGLDGGNQSVKISYTAGYTAATIPDWLKQILIRQTCHWFRQGMGDRWDVSSVSKPGGSTTSFSILVNNLLPDFVEATERHRHVNG